MSALTTTAHAIVHKGPWWRLKRYEVRLFIDDINTGLHWHCGKRELSSLCKSIIDNASALLLANGLMDKVFEAVSAKQNLTAQADAINRAQPAPMNLDNLAGQLGLMTVPTKGSRVELTEAIGKLKAGLIGTVTHVDSDATYPIRVAFQLGADTVELPMNLSEVKAVSA